MCGQTGVEQCLRDTQEGGGQWSSRGSSVSEGLPFHADSVIQRRSVHAYGRIPLQNKKRNALYTCNTCINLKGFMLSERASFRALYIISFIWHYWTDKTIVMENSSVVARGLDWGEGVCEAITWGALLGLWNPFISWQGIVTQINTCARIHWIKCQKVKFTVEYKINIAYDFLKKWLSGSVWWERRLLMRVCARVWEKSSWRLWIEGWVVWFWSHWTGFWVGK